MRMLAVLACMLLLSGCVYPTPRYDMFGTREWAEDKVALLQIPNYTGVSFLDNQRPRASIPDHFWGAMLGGHLYRETTFPAGLHSMEFGVDIRGVVSEYPFITAFHAKAGHTHRIQAQILDKNMFGWIEELPEMMKPARARVLWSSPKRQWREWNKHNWRRMAAGLTKRPSWTLSLEETHTRAAKHMTLLNETLFGGEN